VLGSVSTTVGPGRSACVMCGKARRVSCQCWCAACASRPWDDGGECTSADREACLSAPSNTEEWRKRARGVGVGALGRGRTH
jgi:hypothetical protein